MRWGTRKPNGLFEKLIMQASQVVEGAQILNDYLSAPGKQHARRIHEIQKQADEMRQVLTVQISRTFVTPIDREDLYGLSKAIDDVLDEIYAVIRDLYLLSVSPNAHLEKMSAAIRESAQDIHQALQMLEHQPEDASRHALHVDVLEKQMHTLYAKALAELYDNPPDVIDLLKLHDAYRQMSHIMHRARKAAHFVNTVVIKSF